MTTASRSSSTRAIEEMHRRLERRVAPGGYASSPRLASAAARSSSGAGAAAHADAAWRRQTRVCASADGQCRYSAVLADGSRVSRPEANDCAISVCYVECAVHPSWGRSRPKAAWLTRNRGASGDASFPPLCFDCDRGCDYELRRKTHTVAWAGRCADEPPWRMCVRPSWCSSARNTPSSRARRDHEGAGGPPSPMLQEGIPAPFACRGGPTTLLSH